MIKGFAEKYILKQRQEGCLWRRRISSFALLLQHLLQEQLRPVFL